MFQGLAISGNFLAENLTFPSVLQFRCFYSSTLYHLEYISNKYSEYFQTNICPGVEQTLDFGFFIISIQIFCIVMDITIQGTEEGGIRLERGTLNYRTGTTYIKIRPPLSAVMMIIWCNSGNIKMTKYNRSTCYKISEWWWWWSFEACKTREQCVNFKR